MIIRRSVTLREDVKKRLETFGKFGETYSEMVTRLLDELEENRKRLIGSIIQQEKQHYKSINSKGDNKKK